MNRPTHPAPLPFTFLIAALAALSSPMAAQSTASADTERKTANEPVRRILVSIPDHQLALLEGDRIIKIYHVAVGAPGSPTPSGKFPIVQRLENPTYYKPGVVIGPGAPNPLGPRWIGLNVKGFGIHGTNHPNSIGKNASHGCIRLRNDDIKDLFARVQVGDRVSLIAERTDEIARLFGESPSTGEAHQTLHAKNEVPSMHEIEQQGNR
jgi:lipoprotein-anchoring transpeptidase ErfK/SrfK